MTTQRPNVVLICTDQWRADCFSGQGHPVVRTPYLDDLADRGAVCSNAYTPAPTCVPSRMSLMTGLTPATHRRVGYQDGVDFDIETTLAGELRAAGYQTQAIGKMHYSPERVRIGFDDVMLHDGYLHYSRRRSRPVEEYDDYLVWLRSQAGASAVEDYFDNGLDCNSQVARPWDKPEAWHPSAWIGTEMTRWLYRRDPTVPFFLYLSFHRPHPPLDPPQWAFDQYMGAPDYVPARGDWTEDYAAWRHDRRADANAAEVPQDMLNRARAGYYGHMSHIDGQVNRIWEVLNEFESWDNTVVAFISDHGEMLGEHGLWHKGLPYEGSARIPFILRGPGIPEGAVVDELVGMEDVMPTLLDAVGVAVPESVEGRSILPLLRGESATWREHYHGEHTLIDRSIQWIRAGRYKYVWFSHTGGEQLFDLEADPQELVNLARRPGHEDRLAELRALLVEQLRGRPEGYVDGTALVPGRTPLTLLPA